MKKPLKIGLLKPRQQRVSIRTRQPIVKNSLKTILYEVEYLVTLHSLTLQYLFENNLYLSPL